MNKGKDPLKEEFQLELKLSHNTTNGTKYIGLNIWGNSGAAVAKEIINNNINTTTTISISPPRTNYPP